MTFSTTRLDRAIAAVVILGALALGVPAHAQSSAATAPLKVLRGKLLFKFHRNLSVQHEADVQAIDPYGNMVRLWVDPAVTPLLVEAIRLGPELDLTLQLHAAGPAGGVALYQIVTTAHAVGATLVMATGFVPTLEAEFELPSSPTRSSGPILVDVEHGTPTVTTRMPIPSFSAGPATAGEDVAVCTQVVAGGVAQPVMDPPDHRCRSDEVSSGRFAYNLFDAPTLSPGVPTARPASQLTLHTSSGALRKVLDAAGSTCAPMNLSFRLVDLRNGGVPGLLVRAVSVVNGPARASGALSQTGARCLRTPSSAPPGREVEYRFGPTAPTSTITFENLSTHVVEVIRLW